MSESTINKAINDNKLIFTFRNGIYGFEHYHKFAIINQSEDENNPFRLMVSIDNPEISFIVIPPTVVHENYDIKINELDLKELSVSEINDLLVLSIVTLSEKNNCIFVNLKSPIVLSMSSRLSKQIILDTDQYSIRHRVNLGN